MTFLKLLLDRNDLWNSELYFPFLIFLITCQKLSRSCNLCETRVLEVIMSKYETRISQEGYPVAFPALNVQHILKFV